MDADEAEEGDVLATGEKQEEECDFGAAVAEIRIEGNLSWLEKTRQERRDGDYGKSCVYSSAVPDAGVWPFTTSFKCYACLIDSE